MVEKIQSFISEHPLLSGSIALIAMFLFVFVLFFPSTSKELSKTQTPSQNGTTTKSTDNSGPSSQTKTQPTPWVVGQNEDYIISFPRDWQTITRSVADGGTAVSIHPSDTSDTEFPIVTIEAVPASTATPTQRAALLAPLKLTQTETTFKSNSTIQISGTIPYTPAASNPNQSRIHKTYLIFQQGNVLYTIAYAEYEDKDQQINEQLMKSILNTIQFNQ